MKKILLIIAILFPTNILAIEFNGKFIQGHYILGKTDPSSKIIIDKKKIKVSKNGFFVFGIDRDRKYDILITKISNGKTKKMEPQEFLESVKIIADTKAIKRAQGIALLLPKIKGFRTDAIQNGHTPDNHAAVIFA